MSGPVSTCRNCLDDYETGELDESMACESCNELEAAIDLVIEDLTDNNAHTIAALLESQYRTGYDTDKVQRAYKAAQWELFGTR